MPDNTAQTLRCPTCRATQQMARECRRCKCDLSLVVAVKDECRKLHHSTLQALRLGRAGEAVAAARRRFALAPDSDAARLLAVSYLAAGRHQAALDVFDASAKMVD